ncbi:MAG TPA: helix-turn-helix transcriptional regulator [Gammaproteobacteria bacterium]
MAFNATTQQALDNLAAAFFAIDWHGRLVHSNRAGDDVLLRSRWLTCADGKLAAGKDLLNARACVAAIRGLVAGTGATLILQRVSIDAQRILLTTPISRAGSAYVPVSSNAVGLVWLLPDRPAPTAIECMAQLFELTPAESRLLAQLGDDKDLKTAAELLGISVHTARNELKAILRKTGRRNQGQLLALVNRLAAMVGRPGEDTSP